MSPANGSAADARALQRQSEIVHRLLEQARRRDDPRARLFETHISFVLVGGGFAHKIKKPVRLGFVDFSTLARRRFFCDEEIRLNRRLAAGLYLDVVPVTGSPEEPVLGGSGRALEWAVRMRAFEQEDQWDRMIRAGRLTGAHVDRLARIVADFHRGLAPARGCAHGESARVLGAARENLDALDERLAGAREREWLARLRAFHDADAARVAAALDERNRDGFVRECHGDLHLANIAQVDGDTVVFDCIEFNDSFRWIDVASEIAFPVMDLRHRGRPDLSARLLDAWLEITGDYAALDVLRFYLVYRALVRAKVSAIRAAQGGDDGARAECRSDLELALWYARPARPVLVAMHGLSGAGKTVVSQRLLEHAGAVRVRSDLERKRSHGLEPGDRGGAGAGIYTESATERTYRLLARIAARSIAAGMTVIVDATFLHRWQRAMFRDVALRLGVPMVIVDVSAPAATLRSRIVARAARGGDASDADLAVLDAQMAALEPVADDEADRVWRVDGGRDLDPGELASRWRSIAGAD